jgi:hypothetical protein
VLNEVFMMRQTGIYDLSLFKDLRKEGPESKFDFYSRVKSKVLEVLRKEFKVSEEEDEDFVYYKLDTNDENLLEVAKNEGYKLRLRADVDKGGFSEQCPAYCRCDKMYFNEALFERYGNRLLRPIDRVRLAASKLSEYVNIAMAEYHDVFRCIVPHEPTQLSYLEQDWLKLKSSGNIDDLRDYFGEEIALYFLWCETLT